ncbi:hypothetical protein Pmani_029323 [Petrolisthes manimaculis]|uniref:Uncharacterized protein n=1 Tax=Petrolisthes manimaculis TaxID=1843537 RepID=A0AAE1NYY1_9EUCA|nr:hypothetical protein Pmani_029323 [Petrolisthes manimaculis]
MNGNGDGGERARVPAFGGDKNYDRWKQELKAWKFVTNIGKKKQAMAVALSFPEGSEQALKKFFGSQEVLSLGAGSGNGKSETPAVVVKTEPVEIPYSFDRDTKDGRNSLLDTLRHQTKEGKTEKKEIEAVINPVENPVESYDKEEEYHSIVEDTHEDSVRVKSIPKIGQKVKFLSKESDEWQTVTMHSRAGKSTGKYSNWRNVKYEDGSLSAFDWNRDVEKWIPILEENGVQEPSEIVMACENMENQKLDKAKQEEIKSWKNFGVPI